MVAIQNADAIEAIRSSARLSISEGFPTQLSTVCVPVMDMTPRFHRLVKTVKATRGVTGDLSVFTTDANKDTYITAIAVSFAKDATCDVATNLFPLSINQDGTSRVLVYMPMLTLTAQQMNAEISLPVPMKVDRNAAMVLTTTAYTAGLMVRSVVVYYYEVA